MKKHFLTFLFFAYSVLGFSQFADDFSDGNFTNNPIWVGAAGNFEVDTAFKLHLNDTITNISYLSTTSQAIINGSWEFEIKLEFDPSTSNYAKVYLISDEQDLTGSLKGYFVKIGGESGAIDDVSLFTQNGSSTTKIIDGTDGIASLNPNMKIKVLRDSLGNWELFIDTAGTYFLDGIGFDNTVALSSYFGIFCQYTSTRSDKFWFDNFSVSGSSAVVVYGCTNLSACNYDSIATVDDGSCDLPNGCGDPLYAEYDPLVTCSDPLACITIISFNQNDIIINELFVDPTPSIGLPEYEYIELYNTTNSAINLTDWIISIGTTDKVFPVAIIEPDSFVILIKEDVIDSFPNNISKIGFSSIALTNEGSAVILKDKTGAIISTIAYTDKWYNDANKSDGGWSIERVNPNLFCEGKNNWRASKSNIGGTPGKQNSVFGEVVNIENFRITKAFIVDSSTVQVHFNKSLNSFILQDSSLFEINGNNPILNTVIAPFFNSVNLTFEFNFLPNTTYTILTNGLLDCSGNLISNSVSFGIPDSVLENQIVINEVLFNPKDDGVDYIELFNNSNSYFDLSNLRIANFFEFGSQNYADNPKIITEEITLFPPKSFLLLTSDSAKVKEQYYCENPYNFIEIASIPTLSNDSGTICIVHQSLNQIIDAFAYNESMHFSLLETTDGVSLERLDINTETQISGNWHSAASTVGFGTPSYKNSQEFITQSVGEITVDPKSFSPNNDGIKDVCAINWNFSENNLMLTIKIFDAGGRLVRNLVSNEMIGNSGSVTWDGIAEDNSQLNTGMYIIWVEVFSENGNVERFKEVVVLSR